MTAVLMAVSIVSSAVALAMAVVVLRMIREERRRSDARVEALMRLAGARGDAVPSPAPGLDHRLDEFRSVARPMAIGDDAPGEAAIATAPREPAPAGTLFAEPPASRPWRARLAAAGAAAALLVIAFFALSSSGSPGAVPAPAAASDRPIELLALHHAAEPASLTVTGVVQNPRNGVERSRVTAVALAFAGDGTFLGSGQAPLDFTHLRGGEESPFTVRVATPRAASRYRVSFRDADGRVVAHVDRRQGAALARKD